MNESVSTPESLRDIIARRLTGLAVLLLAVFLASLALRGRGPLPSQDHDGLPTVVIPLQNSGVEVIPQPASTAPDPVAEPEMKLSTQAAIAESLPAMKPKPHTEVTAKPKPVDAAAEKKVKPPMPAQAVIAKKANPPVAGKASRWLVTVGAFKDPTVASAVAQRVKGAGFAAAVTTTAPVHGERLHRVSAGPFAQKAEAESARARLIVEGMTKAVVQPGN